MVFIFAGNWKMNPVSSEDAKNLFGAYKRLAKKFARRRIFMVACPSMPHLGLLSVAKRPKNLALGAQDVSFEREGAFTGEISPVAVYGVGADYVILGHSERRNAGESSLLVVRKIKAAIKAGLKPIVCVGESIRDSEGEFWHQLRGQIEETLSLLSKNEIKKIIIAYEPVWAVGEASKGAMKPEDLHETVLFIRKVVSQMHMFSNAKALTILYGGSVFEDVAKDLREIGNVNGFLVGRASLDKKMVEKILNAIS